MAQTVRMFSDMLTAMPFVYCDQNFVVTTQAGLEKYKAHLRRLAVAGTLTVVCAPRCVKKGR